MFQNSELVISISSRMKRLFSVKGTDHWVLPLLFIISFSFFSFFATESPNSDMYLIANTAKVIANSNFQVFYVVPYPIFQDVRVININDHAYSFYPKALELFLGLVARYLTSQLAGMLILFTSSLMFLLRVMKIEIFRKYIRHFFLILFSAIVFLYFDGLAIDTQFGAIAYFQRLVASLSVVVFFKILCDLNVSRRHAFFLSMIILFGSFLGYYSKPYHREIYYILPILLSIHFLFQKKYLYMNMMNGLLVLVKYQYALLILPLHMLYIFFSRSHRDKKWIIDVMTVPIFFAAFFILNKLFMYMVFGNFFQEESGYTYHWMGFGDLVKSIWVSFVGLTVSSGKGLIFYFPLCILFIRYARFPKKFRLEYGFLCVVAVMFFIFHLVLTYYGGTWTGGWCWGPRYLLLEVFLITILLSYSIRTINKPILVFVTAIGFFMNIPSFFLNAHSDLYYLLSNENVSFTQIQFDPDYSPLYTNYWLLNQSFGSDLVVPNIKSDTFLLR